ncbi:transmembrane protein, putative [Medicago truncatula]|uniref:Transmembrane protein, putative n=1 Tax=Medicago truncatula TaxID=3880 RepID=G7IPW4_MEDTR|nr:transmembrane protein, putative [Medicago truncatula]
MDAPKKQEKDGDGNVGSRGKSWGSFTLAESNKILRRSVMNLSLICCLTLIFSSNMRILIYLTLATTDKQHKNQETSNKTNVKLNSAELVDGN